ncbi:MAG TPA: TlpA disulfide reductase family protein, partial [Planctomycetota bacterium]|nr:TlpA disulfide reductase family protein [Planctomycetota bacterium]
LLRAFGLSLRMGDERLASSLLEETLAAYPASGDALAGLSYGGPSGDPHRAPEWGRDLLRTIVSKATDKEARAASRYWLACLLAFPDKTDQKPAAGELSEAKKLFGEVRDSHVSTRVRDYSAWASGSLFELDHLQVGMTAPDFEATGVDGKKFKLSDFRGKMVVIDFWRNHGSRCDWGRHLPDRKALVVKMKDKPFVLLGVNGDDTTDWETSVDKASLTWPNAVDGTKRTLSTQWGIRYWPAQYLLDAKGVIRMKSEYWWGTSGTAEYDKDGNFKSVGWLNGEVEKLYAKLEKE